MNSTKDRARVATVRWVDPILGIEVEAYWQPGAERGLRLWIQDMVEMIPVEYRRGRVPELGVVVSVDERPGHQLRMRAVRADLAYEWVLAELRAVVAAEPE